MKCLVTGMMLFMCGSVAMAQSLENTISELATEAATEYIKPLASVFGSNLNSAWIEKAPPPRLRRLSLQVSIIGMGSFFRDEAKAFHIQTSYRLHTETIDNILTASGVNINNPAYAQIKAILLASPQSVSMSGPTVIGKKSEYLRVSYPGDEVKGVQLQPYEFTVRRVYGYLENLRIFPSAALQINAGVICGTNFCFRYLPPIETTKLGTLNYWGVGFIHNPEIWTRDIPWFDYGVAFFHQKMQVGSVFQSSATQFGLYASRTFGRIFKITPLTSLRYEMSRTLIEYTYNYEDVLFGTPLTITRPIEIEMTGKNKWSLGVGVTAEYWRVHMSIGYKFASTPTLRGGISIII